MSCELFVGEDNPVFLSGLKSSSGEYVNDAVVTLDLEGELTDESMEYVEDSDGVYRYVVQAAVGLTEGQEYVVTIRAEWDEDGDAKVAELSETYLAVARTRAYGTDMYATCDDMRLVYGESNLDKWADVDNEGDAATIRERKVWALHLASRRVDERLRGGTHAVPFSLPYPTTIVDLTARIAGIILYESPRALTDAEDGFSAIDSYKEEIEERLAQLLDGRLRLPGGIGTRGPSVVKSQPTGLVTGSQFWGGVLRTE